MALLSFTIPLRQRTVRDAGDLPRACIWLAGVRSGLPLSIAAFTALGVAASVVLVLSVALRFTIPLFASACRPDADNLVPDVVWFSRTAAFALSIALTARRCPLPLWCCRRVVKLSRSPLRRRAVGTSVVIWFGVRVITRFRHRRFHRLWRSRWFRHRCRWRY